MLRSPATRLLFALLFAVASPSCRGGGGRGSLTGRAFDSATLAAMAGAKVSAFVGGREVATTDADADGRFELRIPADTDVLVKVEQPDHAEGLELARVPKGGRAHLETFLVRFGMRRMRDAGTTDGVKGPSGESVKLPGNGLVKEDGSAVTGQMEVAVTAFDPKNRPELIGLPGKQRARMPADAPGTGLLFGIRAALSVQMTQNGEKVELASGQTAEIKIPISDPYAPSTLDLFHLDEDTGEWVKIGVARKQRDSMGHEVYSAEVTELSTFAVGTMLPTSCVQGCLDPSAPLGTTVTIEAVEADFTENVQAGEDGCFRADVPLGAQLRVRASTADAAVTASVVVATDPTVCTDVGVLALNPSEVGDAVCPLAHVQCTGECVDWSAHPSHCNGCGLSCGAEEQCVDRTCACPATHMDCAGTCTPVQGDPMNCGACGMACNAGEECVDGSCAAIPCAAPLELCGTYCIDTQNDDEHCGACGGVCGSTQTCVAGACVGGTTTLCFVDTDCPSGDACVFDTCRPYPALSLVLVSGYAHDEMGMPVSGTLTVLGTNPVLSFAIDPGGTFAYLVPAGIQHLMVTPTNPAFWGDVTQVAIPASGMSGLDFQVYSPTAINSINPLLISPANGIVDVNFGFFSGGPNGQAASISGTSDLPYTRNMAMAPVQSPTLLPTGASNITFTNAATGMQSVGVSGAPDVCFLMPDAASAAPSGVPTYPVVAQFVTHVSAYCGPAQSVTGTVCADPDGAGPTPCTALDGAMVQVLDTVGVATSAVTSGGGMYTVNAPTGTTVYVYASAPGHWGALSLVDIYAGMPPLDLSLDTDAVIAAKGAEVGRTFSTALGIVVINFMGYMDAGGETATLSVPSDPPFTKNATGANVYSNALLPGLVTASVEGYLAFANIRPLIGIVPTPAGTCALMSPVGVTRVLPHAITFVHVGCGL